MNDKRAMNQGFGDGLSRAFELVATPAVFGGIGYLIDRLASTTPVVTVVLAAFGVIGTFVRAWYGYDAEMKALESTGRWARRPAPGSGGPSDGSAADPDLWSARRRTDA